MAKPCSVCIHADANRINEQLIEGATLEALAKAYNLSVTALHRHRKEHLPLGLIKAQEAQEIASADSLMGRVTDLNAKAEDVYERALKSKNLNAAISAVRELRGITELIAKITGELDARTVTNILIMPEWATLRTSILYALEPYPEARQAVIEAIQGAL